MHRTAIALLVVLGWSSLAAAESAAPAVPAAERVPHVSVTIEPLYLVLPMVDATIEYMPTPHLGIAAIAGYGHMMVLDASFKELGGQANVYVTRAFGGLHGGVELRYLWGGANGTGFPGGPDLMSSATERIVGVYAGWKWIGWRDLTAILQAGVGRIDVHGDSEPPMSKIIPVANLTVGYSF